MRNPVLPREFIRSSCLEPRELSVTAAAKILSVSRQALNIVVNGRAAINPDMAIRLWKAC